MLINPAYEVCSARGVEVTTSAFVFPTIRNVDDAAACHEQSVRLAYDRCETWLLQTELTNDLIIVIVWPSHVWVLHDITGTKKLMP